MVHVPKVHRAAKCAQHLSTSDPRKDPCYITEVFQHLILQFIIDNHGQEFMNRRVEQTFCTVQGMQASNGWSASHVQSLDATM